MIIRGAQAVVAGLAALGALATPACIHEGEARVPRVSVHVDTAPAAPCGDRHVEIVEGAPPADAVVITRATTEAKEPHLSLRAHEEAAAEMAKASCADGVSVLQATETPRGVVTVTLVFWRHASSPPAARETDAGP